MHIKTRILSCTRNTQRLYVFSHLVKIKRMVSVKVGKNKVTILEENGPSGASRVGERHT